MYLCSSILMHAAFFFCIRKTCMRVLLSDKLQKPMHTVKEIGRGGGRYTRHFKQSSRSVWTVERTVDGISGHSPMRAACALCKLELRLMTPTNVTRNKSTSFTLFPHLCKCFQPDRFGDLLPPGDGIHCALLCARPGSSCGWSCRSSSSLLLKKHECWRNSARGKAKKPYLYLRACSCLGMSTGANHSMKKKKKECEKTRIRKPEHFNKALF